MPAVSRTVPSEKPHSPRCLSGFSSLPPLRTLASTSPQDLGHPGTNFSANSAAGGRARMRGSASCLRGFVKVCRVEGAHGRAGPARPSAGVRVPWAVGERRWRGRRRRESCMSFGHLESCAWRFVSGLGLMGDNLRGAGYCKSKLIVLDKGEWVQLHRGEKFLEIMPLSPCACVHKAERGSEFARLESTLHRFYFWNLHLRNTRTDQFWLCVKSSCWTVCHLHVALYWIFRGS